MIELVTKGDFIQATQLERYRLSRVAGPLMQLTGLKKINRIYNDLHTLEGLSFADAFLKTMQIEYMVDGRGLDKIPSKGAFITIANHPFGVIDGLIMMKIFGAVRPDFKIMTNFLLRHVAPLKEMVIGVNPFEGEAGLDSSFSGIRSSIMHLESGHPLGVFPAGEVSFFRTQTRKVTDCPWDSSVIKLIRNAEVPVIPVYFEGKNSPLFQVIGLLHPSLRTAALPSEILRKKKQTIRVRIGQPVAVKDIRKISGVDRLGRYLRARTYFLGSGLKVHPFYDQKEVPIPPNAARIASPMPTDILQEEVDRLRNQSLMFSQGDLEVFCIRATKIPHILQELGRLREITFRSVGEGTGYTKDLDEYDLYYHHLFLWDKKEKQIAGAYRIGLGNEILKAYGKKGFYTHSLFKMKDGFTQLLDKSAELGRSFVLEAYQRKRLPLFLLWKGIYEFCQKHPQCQYLIGPVSISSAYTESSRQFIAAMVKKYFFDEELAGFVKPRKKYKPNLKHFDLNELMENGKNELYQADKLIQDLEPSHLRLPVLLKKYIRQNAKIIGFNIDPKFNHSLDGFMIMNLADLPDQTHHQMRRGNT